MPGDWLRLYRKSMDSRVFSDDWLWRLWCWCLMKAGYKTAWKDGREILPGQLTVGRNEAADQLNVSPSRFYRGLQTLSDWGQIRLEANNRFTVVTICNWRTYQPENDDERTASEQPVNSQRTTGEHLADTLIRREEGKKGRKKSLAGRKKGEPPKPRPRDHLFDALAEITHSDPTVSGSHIGKVRALLAAADPPYTPEEVRELPAVLAAKGWTCAVTLGVVQKYIGMVRNRTDATAEDYRRRVEAEQAARRRQTAEWQKESRNGTCQ